MADNLVAWLVIFGLILAGGYAVQQGLIKPIGQSVTGFTTLSLTQASFASTSQFFNDKLWIMTIAQGGLGQHATGTISADSIGTSSGTKPASDLKISIDYSKFSWEYPIKVDYASTPIYKYTLSTWTSLLSPSISDVQSHCPSYAYYGKFPLSFKAFCIDETQTTSYMGNLDNCNFHTTATFNVNGATKTIDSKEQINSYIGDKVYVTWNGNLVKQACQSQAPYKPFYSAGWKLGSAQYYSDYSSALTTFDFNVNRFLSGSSFSESDLQGAVNTVNQKSDRFTASIQQFGTVMEPASTDGAYVDLSVTSDVQVPVYTLYVKADLLGIYQPVAKAQIVSSSGAEFKSGEYGNIFAEIRNIGDAGNFNVWAVCTSPFQYLETTKTVSLQKDATATTYLRIGANVASTQTGTCTIKVQAAGTSDIVQATVSVRADPQYVCNAGTKRCDNLQIQQCNSAGSGWTTVQTCASNQYCTYQNAQPVCVDTRCTTNCPPPPPPNDLTKYLPVLILGGAGALLFYAFKRDAVWGMVGGMIGAGIGFIITWFQSLAWWQQLLTVTGLVGSAGIVIYLFGGAILMLVFMFAGRRK